MAKSQSALKLLVCAALLSVPTAGQAGGLIGDVIAGIGNATGVTPIRRFGRDLDKAHDDFKTHNPDYKCLEEKFSELMRSPQTMMCWQAFEAVVQPVRANCYRPVSQSDPQWIREQALIELAKSKLVQAGVFTANEFNGVSIRWCQGAFRGHGIAPDSEEVLLNREYLKDEWSIAPLIAHEMTHIRQYRRMGTNNFKCDYAVKFTACLCQDRRHGLENEAFNFQDEATTKLLAINYHQASLEVTPSGEVRTFQYAGAISMDGERTPPIMLGVDKKARETARKACTTTRRMQPYDSQECMAGVELELAQINHFAARVRSLTAAQRAEMAVELAEEFEEPCGSVWGDEDEESSSGARLSVTADAKAACVAEARAFFMTI